MTSQLITRLVVGEPQTISLGQPVRQALEAPGHGALRWNAGTWVAPSTGRQRLARIFRRRSPRTIVVPSTAPASGARMSTRAIAASALVAVALAVAAPLMWQGMHESAASNDELPIAPAAATAATGVNVVTSAYAPPSGPLPDPQALPMAPPGDSAAPSAALGAPPQEQQGDAQKGGDPQGAAPAAVVPHERIEPVKVAATPRKVEPVVPKADAKQRDQRPVSAVVLDEVSHKNGHGQVSSTPAAVAPPVKVAPVAAAVTHSPAPVTPVVVPAATTAPAVIVRAAPAPAPSAGPVAAVKPTGERGTGLIAITPDGKLAVFTNPQTRLPQQFKIGDRLPGGDVIRSIDVKAGKVVSSSKEYRFD